MGEEVVGLLGVAYGSHDFIDETRLEFIQSFAQQLALALKTQRLNQQAREHAVAHERAQAEQRRLAELIRANEGIRRAALRLRPGASLADYLGGLALEAAQASGARSAGVFRRNPASGELRMVAFACDGQVMSIEREPLLAQWREAVPPAIAKVWMAALTDSEALRFDNRMPVDQHPWPVSRDWHAALGHTHIIDVPLRAGGELIGLLGQCYCGEQAAARFDLAHAQTLAHLAELAIHQEQLAEAARQALLNSERERLERERLIELSRANDALRLSMDALAESGSEIDFLRHALQQIALHAAAHTVWLFRKDADGLLRLLGSSRAGRFSAEGEPGDPPAFRSGLRPVLSGWLGRQPSLLLWRSLQAEVDPSHYNPATLAWHREQGHGANAIVALMSGEEQIGLVGMVFDHAEPLSERQQELVRALSQPLALALELLRLGADARRSAEQAAVLGERNRLAREIHDSIAQTFLAIDMQLRGTITLEAANRARSLAAQGLTEARRAVAALRPQQMLERQLPDALAAALPVWLEGGPLRYRLEQPAHWQALPTALEDQLFRLAQEAVHNVVKHAQAQQLRIELSQRLDETSLLIADDGIGMPLAPAGKPAGFGLQSMQQRAQAIGAQLQWLAGESQGTQLLVSLPHPPPQEPHACP
jgi:signal transduction histidine kinase